MVKSFMRRGEQITILAILVLVVIFLFQKVFSYDTNTAHPYLSEKIIELYENQFGDKISGADEQQILLGSMEEDTPIRWMNHFYEPNQNIGLSGFQTARDWAQDGVSQSAYARGDQSWQTALDYYASGNNSKAFIALGHVLHLIEDMTVPAHTRLDIHVFNGGDPYEQWVKNNCSIAKFDSIYYSPLLETYFDGLALFSNQYFLSEDTIDNNPQIFFIKNDPNGIPIRCAKKSVENVDYCYLACQTSMISGEVCKIDDTVISDYFSILAPKAIAYGAGVVQLFFEQGEKSKQEKSKQRSRLFQELLDYYNKYFSSNLVSSAYASDFPPEYPRLPNQGAEPIKTILTPSDTPMFAKIAKSATSSRVIKPAPIIVTTQTPQNIEIINALLQYPQVLAETQDPDDIMALPGIPVGSTTNGPQKPETTPIIPEPKNETPLPTPIQWLAPELDTIFSSPIFTSSTNLIIFGTCTTNTQSIFVHYAPTASDTPANIFSTTSVSGTIWSAEVAPLPGNNLFYFSALGATNTVTSSMSVATNIFFDNIPPILPAVTSTITATSTTSTIIRIDFSSADELSAPVLFDLDFPSSETEWTPLFTMSASTSYNFTATSSGDYLFRVRASDNLLNYSGWATTTATVAPIEFPYNFLTGAQVESEVVLTKEGSPYILQVYEVPAGKTLRIMPGVVIKGENKKSRIEVKGVLSVEGASDERVIFTSIQDRGFSDTRLNTATLGTGQPPAPWDWVGVWFNRGSSGVINFADFRYSGSDPYLCAAAVATCGYFSRTIYLDTASVVINESTFINNGLNIITSESSFLSISNSTLDGSPSPISADNPTGGIYIKRGSLNINALNLQNLYYGISSDNRSYLWPAITTTNFSSSSFTNVAKMVKPAEMLAL